MTTRGKIKNGKVILDNPVALPNGTEVEVRPVRKRKPAPRLKKPKPKKPKTLSERFKNFVGTATGLPPDASINHDYYLYGTPKQQ